MTIARDDGRGICNGPVDDANILAADVVAEGRDRHTTAVSIGYRYTDGALAATICLRRTADRTKLVLGREARGSVARSPFNKSG